MGYFFEHCGVPLEEEIKSSWPPLSISWTESLPESENLNWLAQLDRRLGFPVDSTEITGLSAFEYGWKVFNALYEPFPGQYAYHKMTKCLDRYLNKTEYMEAAGYTMRDLCDCLLDRDYTVYMADGVRSPENKLRQAREYCRKLRVALREW